MNIKKLETSKGRCRLEFSDGRTLYLSPETVMKHCLSAGSSLSDEKLNVIMGEDRFSGAVKQILDYCSRRNHSSFELARKLRMKRFPQEIIDAAIEKCREMSVVDDEKFTGDYVSELVAKGEGRLKILFNLQKRGIRKEEAEKQLDSLYPEQNEEESAEKALLAKLKILSADKKLTDFKKKEKLFRYLASKGFSIDLIYDLIGKHLRDT